MPSSCPPREQLLEELKAANRALNTIHKDEVTAMIEDEMAASNDLQRRLVPGRERRDQTAEELKRHVRQQGCL